MRFYKLRILSEVPIVDVVVETDAIGAAELDQGTLIWFYVLHNVVYVFDNMQIAIIATSI